MAVIEVKSWFRHKKNRNLTLSPLVLIVLMIIFLLIEKENPLPNIFFYTIVRVLAFLFFSLLGFIILYGTYKDFKRSIASPCPYIDLAIFLPTYSRKKQLGLFYFTLLCNLLLGTFFIILSLIALFFTY